MKPASPPRDFFRLGASCDEYNGVILVGEKDGTIVPQMMWFDTDGEYFAVEIHDPALVPEGFTEVARYQRFVDVITVDGHAAYFEADEIIFYRRGETDCLVLVIGEKEED